MMPGSWSGMKAKRTLRDEEGRLKADRACCRTFCDEAWRYSGSLFQFDNGQLSRAFEVRDRKMKLHGIGSAYFEPWI